MLNARQTESRNQLSKMISSFFEMTCRCDFLNCLMLTVAALLMEKIAIVCVCEVSGNDFKLRLGSKL